MVLYSVDIIYFVPFTVVVSHYHVQKRLYSFFLSKTGMVILGQMIHILIDVDYHKIFRNESFTKALPKRTNVT